MILETQDRFKFAAYLRQDANSNRLLAKQLDNFPPIRDMKLRLAEAQELVAKELESAEEMVLR